jgi:hypothetical protein
MSAGRFNLSALAVRERSITLFLIILVTIAGIYAFFGLGRAEDPPFTVKQMTVITVWPGATAQEMQDQVPSRWKNACRSSNGMTARKPIPGPAWRLSRSQDNTPPSQVQEEFYQARKKLGDEAETSPPA